jgi:hypothetical protein
MSEAMVPTTDFDAILRRGPPLNTNISTALADLR